MDASPPAMGAAAEGGFYSFGASRLGRLEGALAVLGGGSKSDALNALLAHSILMAVLRPEAH